MASCSTFLGRVRGITASASVRPPSSRDLISAKPLAGLTEVPSLLGSSRRTSSRPIPSSRKRSVDWVLMRTCRPERRWSRANICGMKRTASGWSDSSGSSRSRGPVPSSAAQSKPIRRSVPSEKSSSVCQAPLGRQCSYLPRKWGVPRASRYNSSSLSWGTATRSVSRMRRRRALWVLSCVRAICSRKSPPKGSFCFPTERSGSRTS